MTGRDPDRARTLEALLEPVATVRKYKREGDKSRRLALSQKALTMPGLPL